VRGIKGRVAIVTGAGSGIGAAIARRLGEEGAHVALADIDLDSAGGVAAQIEDATLALPVDIADQASVEAMVARVKREMGAPTILVNNAGMNVFGEPLSITDADWRRCMAVDLEGAWNCSRAVLPGMIASRFGAIVNIASNHSFQVIKSTFPYPVAKHALIGMTRALALEYADRGIVINAISPGFIDTPSTQRYFAGLPDPEEARRAAEAKQPVLRLGRPEEIAAIAAFLSSEDAKFMIGANVVADGGVTIRMYE
jgi:NAD(P)-dependent dehydrogenase (short-subunit alcohol dehydrogenase family)